MKILAAILFLSTILSCATIQLSDAGKNVKLIFDTASRAPAGHEEVGTVECYTGSTFNTGVNVEECRNSLRNKAGKLGASFVVVEQQKIENGCVTMVGTAYK